MLRFPLLFLIFFVTYDLPGSAIPFVCCVCINDTVFLDDIRFGLHCHANRMCCIMVVLSFIPHTYVLPWTTLCDVFIMFCLSHTICFGVLFNPYVVFFIPFALDNIRLAIHCHGNCMS